MRRGVSRLDRGAWSARRGASLLLAALPFLVAPNGSLAAGKADRVFTVGNYPVEARAANAVAAKERAIAEGQQAAFRSLLRRIVPVGAYHRIGKLREVKAAELIDGISVRSERNSATEYIASYDFSFQAEAVRRILDREGIPFLDRQAPAVTVVPIYRAPKDVKAAEPFGEARGSDAWLYAWKSLDLSNALTPVNLQPLKREVHADTIAAILSGDQAAVRTASREYQAEAFLLAVLEPDAAGKRLNVTLAGRDAVAPFVLKRSHRLEGADIGYTAEAAAVLALGVLEGRWKAINIRGPASPAAHGPEPAGPVARPSAGGELPWQAAANSHVKIAVEFQSMAEWQDISRRLAQMPEVTDFDVEGLSGRGARISLRYPGGAQSLAARLASQGLLLRAGPTGWILSQR